MSDTDEKTILEILVICDLMGVVTNPRDVIQKLERAKERLERYHCDLLSQPPPE